VVGFSNIELKVVGFSKSRILKFLAKEIDNILFLICSEVNILRVEVYFCPYSQFQVIKVWHKASVRSSLLLINKKYYLS
jgi:hypothetical protein